MDKRAKSTREEIVEAARQVLAKYTMRKTTMEDIAGAAGKAKSSMYYYFKNKEEILEAVVEKEIELALAEIKRAVRAEKTPQGKLRSYSLTRMRILRRLGSYYSALQDEYIEQYSFFDRVRRKYDQEEMAIIAQILAEGAADGVFVIKDVELTSFAIVTALKGFEYVWAAENNLTETERSIDTLFEILFHGILKR